MHGCDTHNKSGKILHLENIGAHHFSIYRSRPCPFSKCHMEFVFKHISVQLICNL